MWAQQRPCARIFAKVNSHAHSWWLGIACSVQPALLRLLPLLLHFMILVLGACRGSEGIEDLTFKSGQSPSVFSPSSATSVCSWTLTLKARSWRGARLGPTGHYSWPGHLPLSLAQRRNTSHLPSPVACVLEAQNLALLLPDGYVTLSIPPQGRPRPGQERGGRKTGPSVSGAMAPAFLSHPLAPCPGMQGHL